MSPQTSPERPSLSAASVGTLGGVDSADIALADLIAGQSEERRQEMEEVAAGIMDTFDCDDEQILVELTGIYAGATGLQPMRWEVEEAVRSVLGPQLRLPGK